MFLRLTEGFDHGNDRDRAAGPFENRDRYRSGHDSADRGHRVASHDDQVPVRGVFAERLIYKSVLELERHLDVWVLLGESRDRGGQDCAQVL